MFLCPSERSDEAGPGLTFGPQIEGSAPKSGNQVAVKSRTSSGKLAIGAVIFGWGAGYGAASSGGLPVRDAARLIPCPRPQNKRRLARRSICVGSDEQRQRGAVAARHIPLRKN
jgi:hypothetical protein